MNLAIFIPDFNKLLITSTLLEAGPKVQIILVLEPSRTGFDSIAKVRRLTLRVSISVRFPGIVGTSLGSLLAEDTTCFPLVSEFWTLFFGTLALAPMLCPFLAKLLKLSTRTKSRPAKRSGWGGVGVFGNSSPALSSCPSPCEWSRRNLMRVFLCPRLYARQKSTCRRFNLRRHVMKKRRYFSDLHFFGHLALALFRCKFPGRLSFKYRNTPKRDSGLIHFIEGKAQSLTDRRLQRVDFTGVKQIR